MYLQLPYNVTVPRKKQKTAYIAARVTEECKGYLMAAGDALGLDQTGALEIIIREYARRNKLTPLPVAPSVPRSRPLDA